jgi:peptidyl-tRNA hydrolase
MPDAPRRLYILGRRDLSASQRTVQACHALAYLLLRHAGDRAIHEWAEEHRTLVILGVEGERELERWRADLGSLGIPHEAFAEPDLGDQITALAVHPSADARLFRRLAPL